jgi:cytochrome bd-type quinol oxidase subunit 2
MSGRDRNERLTRTAARQDDMSARPSATTPTPVQASRRRTATARSVMAAGLLSCAALLGTLVLQVSEVFCDERCQARPWALTWQLLVAAAGLVTAGAMTVCVASGNRRFALAFLLVALGFLCAVAVDVAKDGWQQPAFAF